MLWPEIAYNEVRQHIIRDMLCAFEDVSGKNTRVLRNDREFLSYCQKGKANVEKIAQNLIDDFKNRSSAYIIPYSICTDVEDVFKKYFDRKKPFGYGQKKEEFPDAFIIQSIEEYCKKYSLDKVIVLTCDKDYVNSSPYLEIVNDYKRYISGKMATKSEMDKLYSTLTSDADILKYQWEKDIEQLLNDDTTYHGYCNYDEISDISVRHCEIDFDDKDFYIIDNNDNSIELEVNPSATFSVQLTYHDTSGAFYDKEFDEWIGDEWKTVTIDLSVVFNSKVIFNKEQGYITICNSDYDDVINEITDYHKFY